MLSKPSTLLELMLFYRYSFRVHLAIDVSFGLGFVVNTNSLKNFFFFCFSYPDRQTRLFLVSLLPFIIETFRFDSEYDYEYEFLSARVLSMRTSLHGVTQLSQLVAGRSSTTRFSVKVVVSRTSLQR